MINILFDDKDNTDMKENILKKKSFDFALRIINIYKYLHNEKKEYVMSNQLIRSGTAVGAMVRAADFVESKIDFIHKMSIAQKEINESLFWLELLYASEYLTIQQYDSINSDAIEIVELITSSIKTVELTVKD
jgi:four helix bundle protein